MFHENCKLFVQTYLYTNCPNYMKTVLILKKIPSQSAYPLIVNELLYAFNVPPLRWYTLQLLCFAGSKYPRLEITNLRNDCI